MNALDAGWAVLKMPIVPGSLREIPRDEIVRDDRFVGGKQFERVWEARFRDPETDEVLPMDAFYHVPDGDMTWGEHLWSRIYGPNAPRGPGAHMDQDGYHLDMRRAIGKFIGGSSSIKDMLAGGADRDAPGFRAFGVDTSPDRQRRGYMTAIYDMISQILEREGRPPLTSSGSQTDDGEKFWRRGKRRKPGEWRFPEGVPWTPTQGAEIWEDSQ